MLVKNWKGSYRVIKEMAFWKLLHSHNGCIIGLFEKSSVSSYQSGATGRKLPRKSVASSYIYVVITFNGSFAMCLLMNLGCLPVSCPSVVSESSGNGFTSLLQISWKSLFWLMYPMYQKGFCELWKPQYQGCEPKGSGSNQKQREL